MDLPGRACPLSYRYEPEALAQREAEGAGADGGGLEHRDLLPLAWPG